ncbi:unnamed protein product [Mesocestoides corti]|uniref:Uncharacterized protein n=1 Tax=Mesocestoides corti TaxID=53468 RepID=A0A0R3UFB4_MESCO|nr:unnamed protein product [Mesocestoides corti]
MSHVGTPSVASPTPPDGVPHQLLRAISRAVIAGRHPLGISGTNDAALRGPPGRTEARCSPAEWVARAGDWRPNCPFVCAQLGSCGLLQLETSKHLASKTLERNMSTLHLDRLLLPPTRVSSGSPRHSPPYRSSA